MKDTYYNDLTINTQIQSELDAFFEDFKGIVFAYAIMNKKDPSGSFSALLQRRCAAQIQTILYTPLQFV